MTNVYRDRLVIQNKLMPWLAGENDVMLGQGSSTGVPSDQKSTVFYQVQCALFYNETDAEIFPAHYTWKVTEKVFKMAFMMNKLTMNYFYLIILEIFLGIATNHCEIQVCTIFV